MFGWTLWRTYHGDIRTALLSTANKLLIIGFFLALLMNGETWMADIINMFIDIGKAASGMPGLSPSIVLLQGFKIFGSMLWQAVKSGLMTDLPTAFALVVAALVICACFLVITIQFVITKVQTFLALGMGYFFLAFGGSKWTTNYVERYFAYAVASGVKLMALYCLIGAGWADEQFVDSAGPTRAVHAGRRRSVMGNYVRRCHLRRHLLVRQRPSVTGARRLAQPEPQRFCGVYGADDQRGDYERDDCGRACERADPLGLAGPHLAVGAARAGLSGAASIGGQAFGGNPSGGTPPQPSAGSVNSPSSGSSAGRIAAGVGQMAQVGASAVSRMPHSGSHGTPPQFNGFHH